jgi:hypothetical protein
MTGDLSKLKQCILLLSSQHDGEVVAAARAINRLLGTANRDWHWLADRVTAGAEPAKRDWTDRDVFADHHAAAEWLLELHRNRLRVKEIDFLDTMRDWYGEPTAKQTAWLNDLCRRYGYTS